MRLRLVHTLSLWLLAAVGASVLAMGGVSAWNLREGFSSYLQARDLERLDKFVLIVTDSVRESGGIAALQGAAGDHAHALGHAGTPGG